MFGIKDLLFIHVFSYQKVLRVRQNNLAGLGNLVQNTVRFDFHINMLGHFIEGRYYIHFINATEPHFQSLLKIYKFKVVLDICK